MLNYQTLTTLLKTEYLKKDSITFNGKKVMPDLVNESIIHCTAFLDYDATILTRVTYLMAGLTKQKRCVKCTGTIRAKGNIERHGNYCSLKCSNSSDEIKEKRKNTNRERYGVENCFADPLMVSTGVMKKHGVKNVSELPSVKDKISASNINNSDSRLANSRKTMMEKYGVEYPGQSPAILEKVKATNIQRYGTSCSLTAPGIKEKSDQTCTDRYGVTNPAKSPAIIQKIGDTKLTRYGDKNYNNRAKALETMNTIYGNHYSKYHWTEFTRSIMSNPSLLSEFVSDKTIETAASLLDVASTTLRNALYEYEIVTYDSRKNQYEEKIERLLTALNVNFIRNDRSVLGGKELDFFIPEHNTAIECNGIFWHSELMGKTKSYHLDKTTDCAAAGIKLIHLWDYQFDSNWKIIESMLIHAFGQTSIRYSARNLVVAPVTSPQSCQFFAANHLFGDARSSTRLGLFKNNELVSCMTFGKSRFNSTEYELIRYANQVGTSVQGGASKLFTAFLRQSDVDKVVTYANRDHSDGNLYRAIGFKSIGVTPPSYFYFKNRQVFNRLRFQKHRLCDILTVYNQEISEWENMKLNGYNRFWTTGNLKYAYIRT